MTDELDFDAEALADGYVEAHAPTPTVDPEREKALLSKRRTRVLVDCRKRLEALEDRHVDTHAAWVVYENARKDGYAEDAVARLEAEIETLEQRSPEDETPVDVATDSSTTGRTSTAASAGDQATAKLKGLREIAQHCWRGVHWEKPKGEHPSCVKKPLTKKHLVAHVNSTGPAIGLAPIVPGTAMTRIAVLDFDSHKGETSWKDMKAAVQCVAEELELHGLAPLFFRSSGGNGVHLMMLWKESQDAYSVRKLLIEALEARGLKNGVKGVAQGEVEVFPKQDSVPEDGFGNMFILPFAGNSTLLDHRLQPIEVDADLELPYSEPVDFVAGDAPAPREPVECSADLNELRKALAKIHNDAEGSLDYNDWRDVIFGIHDATGGSAEGLALAHEFSGRSPKYDAAFLDERVWPYIRSREGGITAATIFDMARVADPVTDLDMLDELPELPAGETKDAERPKPEAHVPSASSWSDFGGTFTPPRYIWHHVLQAGSLYALTAKWGHAKTALMLTLMLHVVTGRELGGHKIEKSRVLYLCGENPDDVKLRVKAALGEFGITDSEIEGAVYFTSRPFHIDDPAARKAFLADTAQHGPFGLVVIDTGPAHSGADQENDNREMHRLAMAMRGMIRPLGYPALVALMHPAKDADKRNLQPRGGGAFSGSIDGELCAWNEQGVVELFHRTKFRGPGFEPIFFKLRQVTLQGVHDNFGEPVITVVAEECAARPMRGGRQPKGDNVQLVWRWLNQLDGLGGDGVKTDALIGNCVDELPIQEGKRDRRGEYCEKALRSLQNQRFIRISDHGTTIHIIEGGTQ